MQIIRNTLTTPAAQPSNGAAAAGALGDMISEIFGAAQQAKAAKAAAARQGQQDELEGEYKRAQIAKFQREPELEAAREAARLKQQDTENKFKQRQLDLMAGERADKRREKKEGAMSEVAVPGFELTGQVMPAKPEATKLRAAKGEMDALTQNLNAYEQMVGQHGTTEFTGPASEQMGSLATSIKMNMKNLYELGAITGPDMAILQSQVPDPQSMRALFTRTGSQQAGLKQLRDTLGKSFSARMSGAGYQPVGGAAPAAAPTPAALQPGHMEDGFRFKGGNPADPSAWEQVR